MLCTRGKSNMRFKIYPAIFLFALLTTMTAFGATEEVLYSFKGDNDGRDPRGGVVSDKSGNLYGTTAKGEGGPELLRERMRFHL